MKWSWPMFGPGHKVRDGAALSEVEITLARFWGPAMTRKKDRQAGPAALQQK